MIMEIRTPKAHGGRGLPRAVPGKRDVRAIRKL